ncbi:MAG: GntR family transcriptional regulator [Acidimicrobiales bacterium]
MVVLDRYGKAPLWRQIGDDLRRRLEGGEFFDRFPSDREIVEHYGVSRHTAREAVRTLDLEGLLIRGRGRGGTRVRQPSEFKQPLGAIYSLFRAIESQGVEQSSVVLAKSEVVSPPQAVRMGLRPNHPLLYLGRLRLAGGLPLAIDRSWLPMEKAAPLMDCSFERSALYEELRTRCNIVVDGGDEEIRPSSLSDEEASMLQVAPDTVAFSVERVGRCGEEIIEVRHTVIRGDRYSFVVSWSKSPGAEVLDWENQT